MSAEALVEQIIDRALAVGLAKSQQADSLASSAISFASGGAYISTFPTVNFTPANVEPPVNIPFNASGLDTALYDATYTRIIADLADQFAGFFDDYFPASCDFVAKAQDWLCLVLDEGGTGVNPVVEEQLWQRDRARVLKEVARAERDTLATFAARGFPLPPGPANYALVQAQTRASEEIAKQSRDVAIKHFDVEIENVRFAVQQALDFRIKAVAAAADYIRALALGPQIAAQLATSAADAQARLITAASTYFRARIELEQLKLDVRKTNAGLQLDAAKTNVAAFTDAAQNRTNAAVSLAASLGTQAAAALNAVHGSAQVAVQTDAA